MSFECTFKDKLYVGKIFIWIWLICMKRWKIKILKKRREAFCLDFGFIYIYIYYIINVYVHPKDEKKNAATSEIALMNVDKLCRNKVKCF